MKSSEDNWVHNSVYFAISQDDFYKNQENINSELNGSKVKLKYILDNEDMKGGKTGIIYEITQGCKCCPQSSGKRIFWPIQNKVDLEGYLKYSNCFDFV